VSSPMIEDLPALFIPSIFQTAFSDLIAFHKDKIPVFWPRGSAMLTTEGVFTTMKNAPILSFIASSPFSRQSKLDTVCEMMPLFQKSGASILIIKLLFLVSDCMLSPCFYSIWRGSQF